MPRKSYRDYQADIYPDTPGPEAAMGPQDWLQGANLPPPRISLNPAHRQPPGGSLAKHGSEFFGSNSVSAATDASDSRGSNGIPQAGITNGTGGGEHKLIASHSISNGTAGPDSVAESTKYDLQVETDPAATAEANLANGQSR